MDGISHDCKNDQDACTDFLELTTQSTVVQDEASDPLDSKRVSPGR